MEGRMRLVDHTYRDFSRYLEEGGSLSRQKKMGRNFPALLHELLSEPRFGHIVAWMPHGRALRIIDKQRFMSEVVPQYFGQSKFESFTRQLSGWGFKRLHRPGPDYGCYYHEMFLRGLPKLTGLMVRPPARHGKLAPNPDGEPDLYEISRRHPLPPEAAPAGATAAARQEHVAGSAVAATTPATSSTSSSTSLKNRPSSIGSSSLLSTYQMDSDESSVQAVAQAANSLSSLATSVPLAPPASYTAPAPTVPMPIGYYTNPNLLPWAAAIQRAHQGDTLPSSASEPCITNAQDTSTPSALAPNEYNAAPSFPPGEPPVTSLRRGDCIGAPARLSANYLSAQPSSITFSSNERHWTSRTGSNAADSAGYRSNWAESAAPNDIDTDEFMLDKDFVNDFKAYLDREM